MHALGFLPREEHLSRRSRVHGQDRAERDGVAQSGEALSGRYADSLLPLASVELAGLTRRIAQSRQDGPCCREQAVLACGRGQFGEARPEDEPALEVAGYQPMVLESRCEAVGRRSGETRRQHEAGKCEGARLEGPEHYRCFVEDTDSATVVHVLILPSQHPRWQAGSGSMGKTLAEKVWDAHVVRSAEGEPDLLFIDLHLIHEVTSPQAFDGLRDAGRRVRRPDLTLATEDHNVPTFDIDKPIADPISRAQVQALRTNAAEFGVSIYSLGDIEQGIVHVVGPQLGLTQPGMTVVCGDSHTSTHGAFGALAFGIGTSEVEHVLATQTLPLKRFKTMAVEVEGDLPEGVTAKDLILAVIAKIGTGGGQGYVLEYRGKVVRALSMEARMTVCNMSIEAGARAGLIAPDDITFDYLKGRDRAPSGADWDTAVAYWRTLVTDADASFDQIVTIDAASLSPFVTWGTNPGQGVPLSSNVPSPSDYADEGDRVAAASALEYMGLVAGTAMKDITVDTVFIGSCTNGRIEDLRAAAEVFQGRTVAAGVTALVVPGSVRVRLEAEAEGLDKIFTASGAEWRNAGCSMCLAMNADKVAPGQRSASTSNRNFEGRQGPGSRTHLVSPQVAAATAVLGHLASPADLPAPAGV